MLGSWFVDDTPKWKKKLEELHNVDIENLGIERSELEKILDRLEELGVFE